MEKNIGEEYQQIMIMEIREIMKREDMGKIINVQRLRWF